MPFHLIPYIKTHHPKTFSTLKTLRSLLLNISSSSKMTDQEKTNDKPTPFDPLAPGVPVSYPLKTLEELESRAYFDSFHYPFNRATVDLPPPGAGPTKRPCVLVCHDMSGGYVDDRFVQGGTNSDAYAIWHWYLVDVLVYFSHNLVTLPPPCWTNAAHRHGVKVLGTFIMEWDEGKKLANKLLLTMESAQMYASRLTELAVALGFDGWLINMEVSLDRGQIPNLKEFVSYLSQTMHSSLPGSLVIWYDGVTIDGDLSWQNQLNDKNKPFFDICDGIFINYSWEENYPKLSADVAGDRKFDVYMGIDVFGRGTYGGGQWRTNVALEVIKKSDVSAAIFAPGWIYETKQPPDFQTAQNRWWGLVERSWGTVRNYPKALPFYSDFNQGHGHHIYNDGKQVLDTPWNNISEQSFQPFIEYSEDNTQPIQVSVNFKEPSYSGGGTVTFTGTLSDSAEFTARLFKGHLLLENSPLHFTYSVKSGGNSLLGLALKFSSSSSREQKSIFLAAPGNTLITMNRFSHHFANVVMTREVARLDQESGWVIQESSIEMEGHILQEIRAVCYKSKPEKSIPVDTLSRGPSEYYAALGDIKITTCGSNSKFPPFDSWFVNSQFVSWSSGTGGSKHLSVKIVWELKVGKSDLFPKYNVYVSKLRGKSTGNEGIVDNEYLGVAVVKSFYVSELEVASGISGVKFVIQACGLDGACQKLEECPSLLLQVQGS